MSFISEFGKSESSACDAPYSVFCHLTGANQIRKRQNTRKLIYVYFMHFPIWDCNSIKHQKYIHVLKYNRKQNMFRSKGHN